MAVCGIYKIEEKATGKCYIGQSKDIYRRLREHATKEYNLDDWHSKYQAMPEKYSFEILTRCNPEDLDDEESYYIYKFNAVNNGFNKKVGNHNFFRYDKIDNNKEQTIIFNNDIIDNNIINFNPNFILENSKGLTSLDCDVLIYYIYCDQHQLNLSATNFSNLFNKPTSGDICNRYKLSRKKLIDKHFLLDEFTINKAITNKTVNNININFKKYIKLKSESNKYSLFVLCLIESLRIINNNIIPLSIFNLITDYSTKDLVRYILNPNLSLLNQFYYKKPISIQFIRLDRKYNKIKFIY